jgi:hypothetical protein
VPGSTFTGNRKALAYYGTIQAATAARCTTAQVWEALREAALANAEWILGYPPGTGSGDPAVQAKAVANLQGITISDVNQLRAIAGWNHTAKANLNGADPAMAIDASMIGRPPNAVSG